MIRLKFCCQSVKKNCTEKTLFVNLYYYYSHRLIIVAIRPVYKINNEIWNLGVCAEVQDSHRPAHKCIAISSAAEVVVEFLMLPFPGQKSLEFQIYRCFP